MNFNNIKLAAIDLDGTLLADNKKLCNGAEEIIENAHKSGLHIVPITGRPYKGVPDFIKKLSAVEYIITSNGAQIIEKESAKSIYSYALSNEKSKEIIKILRSFPCMFEPFCDGVSYTEKHIYDFYLSNFKGTPLEEYFTSSRKICSGYDEIFRDSSKCADEFFISCPDEKTRSALMSEVEKIGNVQFCTHRDRFLEISEKGTDKGNALKVICNHIGIDISQTIAFGDGENDILLLEAAGIGVAMKNSEKPLFSHADIIAKTNNENGVCEIISRLNPID
ncbi:MAG: Cof-type HAD-IIB family hydrolase [Eubacterium sp.]|nr:Cof-type HAD-IIB family hydrolase [Eubacterium sp.]